MEDATAAEGAQQGGAASSSQLLTLGLLGVVGVVAVVFAFSSTFVPNDWFALFKAVHVTFAVLWVGGGLLLTILALIAERSGDPAEIATVARQAAMVGEKLFAPAGLIVLLMGISMMINTSFGWGKFWVVVGLIGYALTFVTGIAVLAPLAKQITAATEKHGPSHPETTALIRKILLIARVDVTVLLIVVLDMVTKPFS